jgi:hypothetical protein
MRHDSDIALVVALPGPHRVVGSPDAVGRPHDDAIDGAHRQAKLASGTAIAKDGMHELGRADDGVDRTGGNAQRATDACGLVDARDRRRRFGPACGIQGDARAAENLGKHRDGRISTRRASIDRRGSGSDGLCVGPASRITAAAALRLRKHGIDARGERSGVGHAAFSLVPRQRRPARGAKPRFKAPWACPADARSVSCSPREP